MIGLVLVTHGRLLNAHLWAGNYDWNYDTLPRRRILDPNLQNDDYAFLMNRNGGRLLRPMPAGLIPERYRAVA